MINAVTFKAGRGSLQAKILVTQLPGRYRDHAAPHSMDRHAVFTFTFVNAAST